MVVFIGKLQQTITFSELFLRYRLRCSHLQFKLLISDINGKSRIFYFVRSQRFVQNQRKMKTGFRQ